MDNDETAFVDFKCGHCDSVLCRTDGQSVRLLVTSREGEAFDTVYSVRRVDFVCGGCGLTRIWRRQYERSERAHRRQH